MARILVVDDEPSASSEISGYLRDLGHGYEVDTACDAPEAKQKMAENAYDVVIADMVMPSGKEAGLGVLRAAKQKDSLTQVIVLTGYGNVSNAVESMRAGAIHYLEKRAEEGVEFDILHEQVKEAILRRILLRYVHDVYKSLAQMRSGLSGISSQVQEYSALLDTVARTKDQVLGPLGVKPESGN